MSENNYALPPNEFRSAHTLALLAVGFSAAFFLSVIALPIIAFSFIALTPGRGVEIIVAMTGIMMLLWFGLFVCSNVFFMLWQYRAYKNLEAFGVKGLQHSPGWAVGYWFVPILNLFRPLQAMNEIYHGSNPEFAANSEFNYSDTGSPTLHVVWWAARLLTLFTLQIFTRLGIPGLSLLWVGFFILSEVLIIVIILRIDRRQRDCAGLAISQPSPPPPPNFNSNSNQF